MAGETVSATTIIDAPAEAVFAVLADPARHAAIDGTGWVRESLDIQPLTAAGQVLQMAMYHVGHPDGPPCMPYTCPPGTSPRPSVRPACCTTTSVPPSTPGWTASSAA